MTLDLCFGMASHVPLSSTTSNLSAAKPDMSSTSPTTYLSPGNLSAGCLARFASITDSEMSMLVTSAWPAVARTSATREFPQPSCKILLSRDMYGCTTGTNTSESRNHSYVEFLPLALYVCSQ
eukprot:CAMPEP_0177251494 /NCGR_PEP_ID=MMETSP0367-20130122/53993_1 /TAXON_ID=447022 ORGANISM="Scrippsiella hangoei-like, Strain SHHI-4" /NCGR_SAMPLE_ID=MMETSP0367 /ASSEMBLY_ACC=CAM_ASM_000362 /LENGTH=122 /DNA_ID=CAMNT_0018704425 /DNA_START=231 /DNA_END=599 /DNA_ORIENTATION=+